MVDRNTGLSGVGCWPAAVSSSVSIWVVWAPVGRSATCRAFAVQADHGGSARWRCPVPQVGDLLGPAPVL